MNQTVFFSHLWSKPLSALRLVAILALVLGLVAVPVSADQQVVRLCMHDYAGSADVKGTYNSQFQTLKAGVFHVKVTPGGGTERDEYAFCTDLDHYINPGSGTCYNPTTVEVSNQAVACVLASYPPAQNLSNDEAAGRQAAVWHFSDGFELSTNTSDNNSQIRNQYNTIVAAIQTKIDNNTCPSIETPRLEITPQSAAKFLPDEKVQTFTLKAYKGTGILANQQVTISDDSSLVDLSASTVTTNSNGEATFTATAKKWGITWVDITANITAKMDVNMPQGTLLNPGDSVQKLVLSQIENFPVTSVAKVQWEVVDNLLIQKFHDRNRNGIKDSAEEELVDWKFYYRIHEDNQNLPSAGGWMPVQYHPTNSNPWATITLPKYKLGSTTLQTYDVCEDISNTDDYGTPDSITAKTWKATTPTCHWGITLPQEVSFGNAQKPSIFIFKYEDKNGNGQWDAAEPFTDANSNQQYDPGESFTDSNLNGTWDSAEPGLANVGFQLQRWTTTDASSVANWVYIDGTTTTSGGFGGWTNVPFNNASTSTDRYQVSEQLDGSGGWYGSQPASGAYEQRITELGVYSFNFGNLKLGSLTLNKTWISQGTAISNQNLSAQICVQRTGPGTPAQEVIPTGTGTITKVGNKYCQPVSQTATFNNLWPGNYEVSETALSGWVGTAAQTAEILSGGSKTLNFENKALGGISVHKFYDRDADGVEDSDEEGLNDWTFQLKSGNTIVASQTTKTLDGKIGWAVFSNVIAGDYQLCEVGKDGWRVTSGGECRDVTVYPGTVSEILGGSTATVTLSNGSKFDVVATQSPNLKEWTYTINKTAGQQDLSHWDLGLGSCKNYIESSVSFERDGSTGFYGVKPSSNTITIKLKDVFPAGTIDVLAKASTAYATATVRGPICGPEYGNTGTGALEVTKAVVGTMPASGFDICIQGPSYPTTPSCKTFKDTLTQTWTNLIPGDYYVRETNLPAGWVAAPAAVTGSTGEKVTVPANSSSPSMMVVVPSTPELTVTNTQLGSLAVTKAISPSNYVVPSGESFTICITGASFTSPDLTNGGCKSYTGVGTQTWNNLIPGPYTVSETGLNPSKWSAASISPVTVTVEGGKTGSSTVTNNLKLGKVIATKSILPAGYITTDTFELCLLPKGSTGTPDCKSVSVTGQAEWDNLLPGVYVLSEKVTPSTNAANWTPSGFGDVTVNPDGTSTPAVSNTLKLGKVEATKTVSAPVGYSVEDTFELCLVVKGGTPTAADCQSVNGGNNWKASWDNLTPGIYTLSEKITGTKGSWTPSGFGDVTVESGSSQPVAVSNTLKLGKVEATKTVSAPVGYSVEDTFELCLVVKGGTPTAADCQSVNGGNNWKASWDNLTPGIYTLSEKITGTKGSWTPSGFGDVTVESGSSQPVAVSNTLKLGKVEATKTVSAPVGYSVEDTFELCLVVKGGTPTAADCQSVNGGNNWKASWDNLTPGIYTLSEKITGTKGSWTPSGFGDVTVESGSSQPVAVSNTLKLGKVEATKTVSAPVGYSVEDTFELCLVVKGGTPTTADCQSVNGGNNWKASWDNLTPGIYTLSEKITGTKGSWTPSGFGDVTVESGSSQPVAVSNTLKLGKVEATKTVSAPVGYSVEDTFELCLVVKGGTPTAADCQSVNGGNNWKASWDNLTPGIYTLSEKITGTKGSWTPSGFGDVTVESGSSQPVAVSNTLKLGKVEATKTVSAPVGYSVEDTFELCLVVKGGTPTAADCQSVNGGNNWKASWDNLLPGIYTLSEKITGTKGSWAPSGFGDVTVESGSSQPVAVSNTLKLGKVEATKTVSAPVGYSVEDTFELCLVVKGGTPTAADCQSVNGGNNWKASWDNLTPGIYTLSEKITGTKGSWTPSGFGDVTVESGSSQPVAVSNTLKLGKVEATKTVSAPVGYSVEDTFELCLVVKGGTPTTADCQSVNGGNNWKASWDNLTPGIYTLSEKITGTKGSWTPSGFGDVTVESGSSQPVTVSNTLKLGKVEATKTVSAPVGYSVEDTFELCLVVKGGTPTAADCQSVNGGNNWKASWDNLTPGIYTLSEKITGTKGSWTPSGFGDVTVESGSSQPVTVSNTLKLGKVEATKTVSAPVGYSVEDTFELCLVVKGGTPTAADCQSVNGGNNWKASWDNLTPGIYTLSEKITGTKGSWTPSGFGDVTVESGSSQPVAVSNTLKLGKVEATKLFVPKDVTTTDTFKLCLAGSGYSKNCKDVNSGSNWKATWENLIPQTYTLTEEITGDATRWVAEGLGDVVVKAGETVTPQVTNLRKPDLKFTKKLDWGTLTPVDGSYTFEICLVPIQMNKVGAATEICETVTVTDETSISGTWKKLEPDVQYRVEERGLPAGWILTQIVALPEQQQPQKVTPAAACVPGTDEQCTVIVTVNPYDGKVWIRQEERLVDEVVVTNAYQLGELNVIKTFNWAGASDPNVRFNICLTWPETQLPSATAAKKECVMVGPNGTIIVNGVDTGKSPSWNQLPAGEYTVSEEVVPEYPINPDAWQVSFDSDAKVNFSNGVVLKKYTVEIAEKKGVSITNWKGNVPGAFAAIEITKNVEWAGVVTDELKAKAIFNLCVEGPIAQDKTASKSCKTVNYLGTNGTPLKWEKLEPGNYKVSEEPLATFPMNPNAWIVSLVANEVTTTFTYTPYIVEDVQVNLGEKPTTVQVNNKQIPDVPPTAVTLNYFKSQKLPNKQVKLAWETTMEKNNEGFVVYRATEKDFAKAQPISSLIPSAKRPSTYSVIDTVPGKGTYYYWLVDIETGNTQHVNTDQFVLEVPVDDGGSWSRVFLPAITR
ncbi:MAG: Cys-Gln thioester bond-forming surface protein [Bacteroidales bacterium]